jgi:hypothetical protein
MIGFLGGFDSGKSYVLSKIVDKIFPQGYNQKTMGLNIYV